MSQDRMILPRNCDWMLIVVTMDAAVHLAPPHKGQNPLRFWLKFIALFVGLDLSTDVLLYLSSTPAHASLTRGLC